jgi:CheY-like chemotaxis protein
MSKKKSAVGRTNFTSSGVEKMEAIWMTGSAPRRKSWAASSAAHSKSRFAGTQVKQVLLIDDSALQLRIREEILRGAGFHVSVATTAESALALLRTDTGRRSVGIVVTDHVMPDLSGAEFVRQIREITPELPILVITGLAEAEEDYRGLNVIFRQKPLPPNELIGLIGQHIRSVA